MNLTWLLLLFALFAQDPQQAPQQEVPPDEPGFRIGVAVDQVFLSVTARSVDGGFAKGLTAADFLILEDGVPQEVLNVVEEKVPVKVALLIDISGSTRYSQAAIRRAALHFAQSLEPEDEVAVITFNYVPKLIADWTNDVEKIEFALETTYAKGQTVLNDALYVTFDDLFRDVPGKKAAILLTDGVDTGSSVSFDEAYDLAVRSEAMVYVASKLDEYWAGAIAARVQYPIVPKELTDSYIISIRRDLNRLADTTGGRVLEAQAFGSLTHVYDAVAEELKNQYYVSYVSSNKAQDGRWRNIEIRTRQSGVVVRTRQGYFGPTGQR